MTARKKAGRSRKATRKAAKRPRTASAPEARAQRGGAERRRAPARSAKASAGRLLQGRAAKKKARRRKTTRKPGKQTARARARSRAASLADRLTELVEHAAAGALRRVVESGGREIASWLPEAPEMRREAGDYLRELRELAGLTIDELGDAIELRDHSVLKAVEAGTATLSFELILRLAAILARHDPVPFISRMVRSYNPVLWQLLEDWGIGRLPLQLAREREFVGILRGHDEARTLSDEDFEQVLHFTRAAFETALHFSARPGERAQPEDEGQLGRP